MRTDHDERIPLFIQAGPYDALIQLLNSSDEFIRLKSASLLAVFLSQDSSAPQSSISSLYNGLNKLLKLSSAEDDWDLEVHGIVIQAFATVFRKEQGRKELWRREKGSSSDPKIFEGWVIRCLCSLRAQVHIHFTDSRRSSKLSCTACLHNQYKTFRTAHALALQHPTRPIQLGQVSLHHHLSYSTTSDWHSGSLRTIKRLLAILLRESSCLEG